MSRQPGLFKSRIMIHRQCPRRLWLQMYRPELAEEEETAAEKMAVGREVGEVARELFPGGLLMPAADLAEARRETAAALARRPRRPLFEATFSLQRVLVQADILHPYGNGYRLAEVKSAGGVKDYHQDDAAVQVWVIRQSGIRLHRVDICHLNREFRYPGGNDLQGMFTFSDITAAVKERQAAVPGWISSARRTLNRDQPPEAETGEQCRKPFSCPFLDHCEPGATAERKPCALAVLPHAHKLIASLREEGYTSLRKVPARRLTKPIHSRIHRCLRQKRAEVDPTVGELLRGLPYPRYYLDFETMQFAIPVWAGTSPLAQVPFQWSCHREKRPGGRLREFSFLADGSAHPPCRELTATLLTAVGETGPIFVYSPFEKSRLKELAQRLPDLAPAIEALIARLVDLLPIARNNYYHPDLKGSWSLKAVLPTIAPDLDYNGLAVGDGLMAQDAFREIMHPVTKPRRRSQLRRQLIEYCGLDTLALVRLVHFFMAAEGPDSRQPKRKSP